MRKLGGNIAKILYSKSREHPAKRFSQYWDIPEFLLIYAYNDAFIDGKGTRHSFIRLNASLSLIGKTVSEDRFDNFIVAGKKYTFWQEKRLHRKAQSTLVLSKELAQDIDFTRKNPTSRTPTERKG